jgi:hypothetical protein
LVLDWPPLGASGQGNLALDTDGRPGGELDLSVAGSGALIDSLARAGRLSDLEAVLARAAFAVLAAPQGGVGGLKVAAVLRDGGLYLGPLRIAGLPSLR